MNDDIDWKQEATRLAVQAGTTLLFLHMADATDDLDKRGMYFMQAQAALLEAVDNTPVTMEEIDRFLTDSRKEQSV